MNATPEQGPCVAGRRDVGTASSTRVDHKREPLKRYSVHTRIGCIRSLNIRVAFMFSFAKMYHGVEV